MKKIGILSDTHSYLHPRVFEFFRDCDEIWHAGDIGSIKVADELSKSKKLRAVYGNIDGAEIRKIFPKEIFATVEGVKILMTHIGGYPGHYPLFIRELIELKRPDLFVCGHSHILKVIYDKQYGLLHINPGAAGNFGIHQSVTMVRFNIRGTRIEDLEILDIPRGKAKI